MNENNNLLEYTKKSKIPEILITLRENPFLDLISIKNS